MTPPVSEQITQRSASNLALAFNYGRKDDQGQRPTQWVDAALWGKLAESLKQYLIKGKQVTIVGASQEGEPIRATLRSERGLGAG